MNNSELKDLVIDLQRENQDLRSRLDEARAAWEAARPDMEQLLEAAKPWRRSIGLDDIFPTAEVGLECDGEVKWGAEFWMGQSLCCWWVIDQLVQDRVRGGNDVQR
jgi:hypothetical protein